METLKFCVRYGVIFIVLFSFQPVATGYYEEKLKDTKAYSTMELKSLIEEFQARITLLDSQSKETEKELDWLILKINRIQDAKKIPPSDLKPSVMTKEKKIQALLAEKKRLETLKAHYAKEVDSRNTITVRPIPKETAKVIPKKTSTPAPVKHTRKSSDIEAAVKRAGLDDWVQVSRDGTCTRVHTTLPILFSSGSAIVAGEYHTFLKKFASFLKNYDVKVHVNGYTDTDPIHTQQFASNFELGAARAANIIHALVKYGIKPSVFKIETTGEHRFAAQQPSKQKSFQRKAQVTAIFSG